MDEILGLSVRALAYELKHRKLSPVEVLDACLSRIEATESKLNAYVTVLRDSATAAAKKAEAEISSGRWRGVLHGVPVAVKDVYDFAGTATTSSSRVRANWIRDKDSVVVSRLKACGAVIVGKTHTHEFTYGSTTPTSGNPWDPDRTPGGSSGGSAAAVASCSVFMATGTDTAGSVRTPSSACGVVGLKPTFNSITRAGVTALCWSLDTLGVITRSVESAADSARILADKGARDAERPKSNPEDNLDEQVPSDTISGLRIGIPDNYFFEHVDTEVETAVRNAYEQLESLGARPVHIKIPFADKLMATEATIAMAEASAYHRRMLRESAELYTDGVRVLLEAGELISASDYLHAQRVRTLIQKAFHDMYEKIDVLVTPTVPAAAVTRNTDTITWRDGVCEPVLWAYTRYAVPANLTGLPALSMPCGFTTSGLPIGLQMIGRPFYESAMLNLGAAYEAATNWHKRYPPI